MTTFRYPMDFILRQHEWEIDALKRELLTLNQVLEAHQAGMRALRSHIDAAEQEIMSICRENTIIVRGRKEIVEVFLREQRRLAEEKQRDIEQARALAERVYAQLNKKKQSHRVIQKHRERKQAEFAAEALRRDALATDELWLARLAASN